MAPSQNIAAVVSSGYFIGVWLFDSHILSEPITKILKPVYLPINSHYFTILLDALSPAPATNIDDKVSIEYEMLDYLRVIIALPQFRMLYSFCFNSSPFSSCHVAYMM